MNNHEVMEKFPELAIFQPKRKPYVWCNIKETGKNIRRTILALCIAMC